MTGNASQVILNVIAEQLTNGIHPWAHTRRLVIPTPTVHDHNNAGLLQQQRKQ